MMNEQILDKLKSIKDLAKNSEVPIYAHIHDVLKKMIISGELPNNYRLPSSMKLAAIIGVNHITLAKALNELRKQGLLERNRAIGTIVRGPQQKNASVPGDRQKLVAVIYDDVNPETFRSELFISIHDNLQKNGFEILFLSSSGRREIQFEQIKGILQKPNCCGCLVWPLLDSVQVRELMAMKPVDFPLVFLDKYYEDVGHDSATFDNFGSSVELGKIFIGRNYRKFVFLVREAAFKFSSVYDRYLGLRAALVKHNLDPDNVTIVKYTDISDIDIRKFLRKLENAVLVAAWDTEAKAITQSISTDGHDASVLYPMVSYDSSSLSGQQQRYMNISRMDFSENDLAKAAINILLSRLNGDHSMWKRLTVKGTFEEKKSSIVQPYSKLNECFA